MSHVRMRRFGLPPAGASVPRANAVFTVAGEELSRYVPGMTPRRPPASGADRDCAFCDIVEGRSSARIVQDGPLTVAFFPDCPAVRGHTLVVPRVHVSDFLAAAPETASAVASACAEVGRALQSALAPAGMNALTSKGRAATQSVFHWHVHLLPRWDGDALGDLWPPDQPTPAAELDALAKSVRQSFFS